MLKTIKQIYKYLRKKATEEIIRKRVITTLKKQDENLQKEELDLLTKFFTKQIINDLEKKA